jgi:hypothetical protein
MDGDIGYFSDFNSSQDASREFVAGRLRSIKMMFDELQARRTKLTELQSSCQKLAEDVSQSRIIFFSSTKLVLLTGPVESSPNSAKQSSNH